MSIRVLALNDDNYETSFVTEDSYYSNAASFMRNALLRPHTEEYQVRSILLINLDESEEEDFNLLDSIYNPLSLNAKEAGQRQLIFDKFWEKGERFIYV